MMQRRLTIRMNASSNSDAEYTPLVVPKPALELPSIKHNAPKVQRLDLHRRPTVASHLGEKILGDVLVAFGVTLGVAPFMTVADKAIVQRANGSHSILSSAAESLLSMARNPVSYVKSPMFLMMWGVYGATYATANSLKTIVEHQEHHQRTEEARAQGIIRHQNDSDSSSSTSSNAGKLAVFTGTTIVNSTTSLLKDRAYATMFGTAGAASTMPLITYGLWATRDLMVVGSSFILPELVGKKLQDEYGLKKDDALRLSQLTVPIATQFLAGPVQLLGLDFYNRPLSTMSYTEAAFERTRFLAQGFWSVVAARVARIAPAYSIGGVFNTKFRDAWRDRLIRNEQHEHMIRQDHHHYSETKDVMTTRIVGLVNGKRIKA